MEPAFQVVHGFCATLGLMSLAWGVGTDVGTAFFPLKDRALTNTLPVRHYARATVFLTAAIFIRVWTM
jgi:hypothetical protein